MGFTAMLRKCLSAVEYVHHVTALRKGSREGCPCCLILLGPLGSVEPETEHTVRTGSLCYSSLVTLGKKPRSTPKPRLP